MSLCKHRSVVTCLGLDTKSLDSHPPTYAGTQADFPKTRNLPGVGRTPAVLGVGAN